MSKKNHLEKYTCMDDFLMAANLGKFTGYVVIGSDFVAAYQLPEGCEYEELVYDFDGADPRGALMMILKELRINAEDV